MAKEKKIKEKKVKTKKVKEPKVKAVKGGLTSQLTKMSLVPLTIASLVIAATAIVALVIAYNNNYTDEALSLADAYAASVENKINDLDQQFDVVTENPDIVNSSVSPEERLAILANRASTSSFEDFYVAYSDGVTLEFEDITKEDFYLYTIDSKGSYVSSPTPYKSDENKIYIKMAKYFVAADNNGYIVYGNLDVDIFNNIIKDVSFGEGGLSFILDRNGQIIATSNSELLPVLYSFAEEEVAEVNPLATVVEKEPTATEEAKAAEKAKYDEELSDLRKVAINMLSYETSTVIAKINGISYFIGFTPVEGEEGWALAVATPLSQIISNIAFVTIVLLVITLIIIAVVGAALRISAMRIAAPVTKTADRLAAFAAGDITSPAPKTKCVAR